MTLQGWTALTTIAIATALACPAPATADDAAPPPPALRPSRTDVAAAMARFNSGKQLIARGDYAAAIAEIQQAYELDPRSEHLYNLAVAYQNNAQRDKAIEYYRRYLSATPEGKLAPDAQLFLYQLEAEAAAERADQERAEATAALAEAMAARGDATAARAELAAAKDRADRAEQVARERAAIAEQAARTGRSAQPIVADADRGEPLPGAYQGIAEDASSGRGWVMPTALMAPTGSWTLSDFELFVIGGSYAATDRLTVSLSTLLPVSTDRAASLNAKILLFGSDRLRVAAQSMLAYGWSDRSDDTSTVGNVGGVATLCLDLACRSHLSGYLGVGLISHGGRSGLAIGGGSLALALGGHLKAVFELENGTGYDVVQGSLGWYGLRFNARAFAFDLGLATPLGAATQKWGTAPRPFLSFTFRASGN